ncbi:MAG: hypothetical protein JWN11_516, partial [Hyphomicrobiales bacterium]|nr:hypothetical protein [Hyphomicrobiales bacterium]
LQALFDDNCYYSMAADRCTGFVSHVSPLYPAADDNSGYYDNGSGYGGRSNDFGGYGY